MNNLFNLVKYELSKIYFKKSTVIAIILLIAFAILGAAVSPKSTAMKAQKLIKQYYTNNHDISKVDKVTEEEKNDLRSYTNIFDLDTYKEFKVAEMHNMKKILKEAKKNGDTGYAYKSMLKELDMLKKLDIKAKPYYFGFWGFLNEINSSKSVLVVLLLCLCLGLSGVFSEEYAKGVDALILSSKHGKKTIIRAKIISSCIYSSSIALLFWGTVIISFILKYRSLEGFNVPMQLLRNYDCPYNLNLFQLFLAKLSMTLIGVIAFSLLLLMCSSKINSTLKTFFAGFALVFIPSYIAENLLNIAHSIFAVFGVLNSYAYFISPSNLFVPFNPFCNLFTIPVLTIVACGTALVIFSIISIYVTGQAFRKHQVTN